MNKVTNEHSNITEQCCVCEERYLLSDLQRGVIDKETGLELFCNDCYESAEIIIGNQTLDEVE